MTHHLHDLTTNYRNSSKWCHQYKRVEPIPQWEESRCIFLISFTSLPTSTSNSLQVVHFGVWTLNEAEHISTCQSPTTRTYILQRYATKLSGIVSWGQNPPAQLPTHTAENTGSKTMRSPRFALYILTFSLWTDQPQAASPQGHTRAVLDEGSVL